MDLRNAIQKRAAEAATESVQTKHAGHAITVESIPERRDPHIPTMVRPALFRIICDECERTWPGISPIGWGSKRDVYREHTNAVRTATQR